MSGMCIVLRARGISCVLFVFMNGADRRSPGGRRLRRANKSKRRALFELFTTGVQSLYSGPRMGAARHWVLGRGRAAGTGGRLHAAALPVAMLSHP